MQKFLLLFVINLSLLGCGFHLRGTTSFPAWLDSIGIFTEGEHHDLKKTMEERLADYSIYIPKNPIQAHYWLILEKDDFKQEITYVGASTAPRQYLLLYEVQFRITQAKGKVLLSSHHISVLRQLTINNDRILGSDAEERLLKNEMRLEAVQKISRVLSKLPPPRE